MAENLQIFEITKTVFSNSERSEQFLKTECFFNLFLEVFQTEYMRTIRIQIGENNWDAVNVRKCNLFIGNHFDALDFKQMVGII